MTRNARTPSSLTDYQRNQFEPRWMPASAPSSSSSMPIPPNSPPPSPISRRAAKPSTARDTKWNAEDARIDNAYKTAMADYTNKKTAYDKAKTAYDNANIVTRQFITVPADPGIAAPCARITTDLKSSLVADLDAQIKFNEAELAHHQQPAPRPRHQGGG